MGANLTKGWREACLPQGMPKGSAMWPLSVGESEDGVWHFGTLDLYGAVVG